MQGNKGVSLLNPLRWVWTAPGEQDKLQEALEIGGAGYPALAALNIKKTAVLHHRGGFSSDSINEFLQYVTFIYIMSSVLWTGLSAAQFSRLFF